MFVSLFHRIEDAHAILRRKGVYYQAPMYHRLGRLYAKVGGGFVLLMRNGYSTHPDIAWEDISDPGATVLIMKNADPKQLQIEGHSNDA